MNVSFSFNLGRVSAGLSSQIDKILGNKKYPNCQDFIQKISKGDDKIPKETHETIHKFLLVKSKFDLLLPY